MKKVYNARFKETYYEETLENGLHVVLWHKPHFQKSFFLMGTSFGAMHLKEEDEYNTYTFKSGIAHFLEHKMFEKNNYDVMEKFTDLGSNCNAFTSYNETAYYFSTSDDYKEPLCLLLDFVQELSISEESVEKEKGIIIQELEMYMQMSETRILNETMLALYHNHPLRYDIGGDKESVLSTTKEDLELCYALNYHPSKMILVGVSGEDPYKIMDVIKENQNNKVFDKIHKLTVSDVNEPYEIVCKEREFSMDITIPKVCLAYKCEGIKDARERNKVECAYKFLFDMYFSSLNPDLQKWIDDEIINNSFTYEIDFGEDYGMILLYSETYKEKEFIETMQNVLRSITTINEEHLEQLKRRYFGVSVNALASHKHVAITYMRTYFAKQDFFGAIEDLENITIDDIYDVYKKIDLKNYSIVKITPNKQEY